MKQPSSRSDEVDQLLLNARLRDELEPFVDDSLHVLNLGSMPTRKENEYLASMLAWERAPVLPIARWFEPELELPHPDSLDEQQLRRKLHETLAGLYEKRIVLECTEHLSDRQLYCLIVRDILPAHEKKIDAPRNYLHWHCLDADLETDLWLRYYATEDERDEWQRETGEELPPAEKPPFSRRLPRRPK